jgi:ACR3 family arsenite efflux pump ArsB
MLGLGFLAANVVPAGAASIGYVLICDGDVELAAAVVVCSIAVSVVAAPLYLSLLGSSMHAGVPVARILESLGIALGVPLALGQAIRRAVEAGRGRGHVERELKSHLSLLTMTFMLALVFTLVASKARVVVERPLLAAWVVGGQALVVASLLALAVPLSRLLGLSYEEHAAAVFPSISKNQSVAVVIAACALHGAAVLAPAIIPAIQPLLCIAYIHAAPRVRSLLGPAAPEAV